MHGKRILQLWWNKSHVACVGSLLRLIFDLVQDVVSVTIYKDQEKSFKVSEWRVFELHFVSLLFNIFLSSVHFLIK